jgi:hypothetical protein
MAKHDLQGGKKKEEKGQWWGLVSEYQKEPLFDRNSDLDHSFAGELYNRRKDEVDECAKKAGFKLVFKNRGGMVTFRKQ